MRVGYLAFFFPLNLDGAPPIVDYRCHVDGPFIFEPDSIYLVLEREYEKLWLPSEDVLAPPISEFFFFRSSCDEDEKDAESSSSMIMLVSSTVKISDSFTYGFLADCMRRTWDF